MSSHSFVDESKRAGYVIAAVTVTDTRAPVRSCVLWYYQVSGEST